MYTTVKTLRGQQEQLQSCASELEAIMRGTDALPSVDRADVYNCIYDLALTINRLERLIKRLSTTY